MKTINYKGVEYPVLIQHHRLKNELGQISPKGGKTIAYIKISDTEKISQEAICHPIQEQFSKKLGRKIATGRLIKYFEKLAKDETTQ